MKFLVAVFMYSLSSKTGTEIENTDEKHRQNNHDRIGNTCPVIVRTVTLLLMERSRIKELHRIVRDEHYLPHTNAPCMSKAPAKAETEISDSQNAGLERTAIEPIRIEGNGRMRLHPRKEHQERNHTDKSHDELIRDMRDSIRYITHRPKGQELIQAELREAADNRAKRRTHNHRNFHVALNRALLRRHAFVRRKEDEVNHLEANRQKRTDAGQLQKQGNRAHVRFFR